MTKESEKILQQIDHARHSLEHDLEEIYHRVNPKTVASKISVNIKTQLQNPKVLAVIGAVVALVVTSIFAKRKRSQKLIQSQLKAEKAYETFKNVEDELHKAHLL